MAWFYLFAAGLFEFGWATGLVYSKGLTKPWVSAAPIVAGTISFVLLALAMGRGK